MLTTTTLPPRGNHRGYTDALECAINLPAGEYVKLDLPTQQAARSAKSSLYQAICSKGYDVSALLRGNSVYIGRAK
jgi:hypothetical protein